MAKERYQTFQEHHLTKEQRQAKKTERTKQKEQFKVELFSTFSKKHRTFLGKGVCPTTEACHPYTSTHFFLNTGFLIVPNAKGFVWERARQHDLTPSNINNQADLTEIFFDESNILAFMYECNLKLLILT